ncbi:glycosyltransferase [Agromyces sp. LHK192]|uniref:glycosyltransferase n=1 Tax=Agromyces sp. LHK192 TaxID=2498704 RepID=UPI000FD865CF|nr:nucleotide disphospho-sugar-binding domain-containing protein [Agromyces sp. LHK192]
MSTYLLCANPIEGHVGPVVAVARDLVFRGHDVTVLTGSRFRARVEAVGASHRPLGGIADYDDRSMHDLLPDRDAHRGIAKLEYDIQTVFIRPIPDQYRAVDEAVSHLRPDAIIAESAFAGVVPLLLDDPAGRPPVVGLGVLPLSQSGPDVAPYGLGLTPSRTRLGRLRNRALNLFVQKVVFRRTQRFASDILRSLDRPEPDFFILDLTAKFDRFLQLSAEEFEYPRERLSRNVRFAGTVLPPAPDAGPLPDWWDELDGTRRVVHVSQGTIDNADFDRLVRPTLDALDGEDLLVVVSTGGRPVSELGELPPNARAAEFLPYDLLFPKLDLFVTNAGYGGVQYALSHGVPLVVAGDTEDKPEVSARVGWTGVGANLRTGTPGARAIGAAVQRVLADRGYSDRATALANAVRDYDAYEIIAEELDRAVAASALLEELPVG